VREVIRSETESAPDGELLQLNLERWLKLDDYTARDVVVAAGDGTILVKTMQLLRNSSQQLRSWEYNQQKQIKIVTRKKMRK
jgi:hypothetical protein